MTTKRYLQLSFLLPLVLPFAMLPLKGTALSPLPEYLYYSLWVAGVPYVMFAICALVFTRSRRTRTLWKVILASPVICSLLFSIYVLILDAAPIFSGEYRASAIREMVYTVIFFTLIFGYGYILLVFIGHSILSAFDLIKGGSPESPDPRRTESIAK